MSEYRTMLKLFREKAVSKGVVQRTTIALTLIILLGLMFPRGEAIELDYKVGAIWAQKDLIAPFSFPIFRDEKEYAEEVEAAKRGVYPVFERDRVSTDAAIAALDTFFLHLEEAISWRRNDMPRGKGSARPASADSAVFPRLASQLKVPFSELEWEILGRLSMVPGGVPGTSRLEEMKTTLARVIKHCLQVGVLDTKKSLLVRPEIALRRGSLEEILPAANLYDHNDIVSVLENELLVLFESDSKSLDVAVKIGVMLVPANIRFSRTATEEATAAAVDAVSRTVGFVQDNERIVSKHERISQETKLKLDSLRRVKAEKGAESDPATQFVGTTLHVTIVVILFGIYLFLFRKRIFGTPRRLALIALIILMEGFFAYLTRELEVTSPVEYLIFIPAASMLLTIIFDSRVGFYGTVTIAFLVAGVRGNDYSIALASLVAGALSVYTVRDVKNRTQIFRSLGFIVLGYALSIIALALERFESVNVVIQQFLFALVNAVVSPVLTYGLLIFFERFFKVTTDLTLIELSHFNHPLLRMLAERAPGTYHHSMMMASMAEAAAAAVGANEVLARVGACFHDIGKVEKPTYFVENQKGARSRHDKLSPRMSSLIIASHVKEGIALARQYNLPEEVIDFIPMHHGTTRIEYFYNKALKLAESSADETKVDEIKEQDYRYPGPRPQTRETGILMLADATEATVRTLDDPAPQKLEAAIDEIIKKRFGEGELDECPLTLKDLTKIKAAFLNVLVGVYHSRVKYPEVEDEKLLAQDSAAQANGRLSKITKEIDKG